MPWLPPLPSPTPPSSHSSAIKGSGANSPSPSHHPKPQKTLAFFSTAFPRQSTFFHFPGLCTSWEVSTSHLPPTCRDALRTCFSHYLFAHDPANPHFQFQVWGLYLDPEAPPPHLPLPLHPASVSLYLQDSTNRVDQKYLGRIVSIQKGTIFLSINFPKLHCIY